MSRSVHQVEGFVLHTRDYTDSKKIITFFTESIGRFSGVIRKSKRQTMLAPFTKCCVDFSGNSALKTIRSAETIVVYRLAYGRPLFCGMYINELLVRTLPELHSYDLLVQFYEETIMKLCLADTNQLQEVLLRRFEFFLLKELGMEINFTQCIDQKKIIANDDRYIFRSGSGFERVAGGMSSSTQTYTGSQLCAIASEQWHEASLKAAKQIARMGLLPVLGSNPIKARELFV